MKRNSKIAILIVLVALVIFIWMPKGKKTKDISSDTSLEIFDHAIPVVAAAPSKRTGFADWGRNPFIFPHQEHLSGLSKLALLGIIWDDGDAQAIINESVLRVGDKIDDKTVKQIERSRVILTDGTKDYILKLQE